VFENVTATEILHRLQSLSNPANVAGMARYGIHAKKVYGISLPELKRLARHVGKDHHLAQALWSSGAHEARLLACFVENPAEVTRRQMDLWASDFDNWAVCDGCCLHLFARVPFAREKATGWSVRRREFVKRAGFSMMAVLAVHDKAASDSLFLKWLGFIQHAAKDERNFVKKAVNWALRQIGKRNVRLNWAAIRTSEAIQKLDSPSARWIAADALRELTSDAVQKRLQKGKMGKARQTRSVKMKS
jgi:3-methyladenine DNA glycosylase AlkD